MSHNLQTRLLCCCAALLAAFAASAAYGADDENLGRMAEERGELYKAFTFYLSALSNAPEESKEEVRLQEKIIKLAPKLDAPPAVPAAAKEHLFRGQEQFNDTTYTGHWRTAIVEFRAAVQEAPWWADGYYKLALAQEGARQYAKAACYLKLYLLAAPDAANAKQVKAKISALDAQVGYNWPL